MENTFKKSLLEMCRGAFIERADCGVGDVIENILDPNTKATAVRELTVTFKFKPDESRQNIAVDCHSKVKLVPMRPITTFLYVADEDTVVEMAPQIPGQMSMDGHEQEAPATLRVIKFA